MLLNASTDEAQNDRILQRSAAAKARGSTQKEREREGNRRPCSRAYSTYNVCNLLRAGQGGEGRGG